jgi:hypothetical protein
MNHDTNQLEVTILIGKFSVTYKILIVLFYIALISHFMILGGCVNLDLFLLFGILTLEFWLVAILRLL